jgi:hypothetical protein
MRTGLFIFSCVLIFFSCSKKAAVKPGRAFYFWKTTFSLDNDETRALAEHHINTLYIRFFDVAWDEGKKEALPVGTLRFEKPVPANINIIPVVYITVKALANTPETGLDTLSKNILAKVNRMAATEEISWKELQLDCDWTESTRDKYFRLLKILKAGLDSSQFLSATIRLHQVKYVERTGVPPVARAMLMFYNMGKIGEKGNSIFNSQDASRYTQRIKSYPLSLDVALPVFGWAIQLRYGKPVGLLSKVQNIDLEKNQAFEKLDQTHYRAIHSFYMRGSYVKENDILQVEEIGPALLDKATKMAAENLKMEKRTVALFDLDSVNINRFEKEDITKAFAAFE